MDCKGLCSDRCGAIPCSSLERKQLEARGKPFGTNGQMVCTMLKGTRCTAYSVRPLICRVWGTTEKLRCPHGCEPERWLSEQEFNELAQEMQKLSGDSPEQMFGAMLNQMSPAEQARWQLQLERHERKAA